jgi:hypothetical protein
MLQGIDRHSEIGVMKANWTASDYSEMVSSPLPFTPVDIQLIHLGLAARARADRVAASNSASAAQDAQ